MNASVNANAPSVDVRRVRDIAFVVAVLACIFLTSPLHLPLNNPNEGVRVFAAKALVEHHTFAIDDVVREWGYIDDKATHDGRLYSSKAPLSSMIGALAYAPIHVVSGELSRPTLTRLCRGAMALVCLVPLWIVWRALRRRLRDDVIADLVVAGIVFAVLPHFNVLSGHALAALAPAAAFALIGEGTRRALVIAGALLAAAVCAEYPALLACAPLAVLAWREHGKRVGWLVLGGAPVVVVVAAAHTAMFGAPWRTGYGALENVQYQKVVEGTLFGIGAPHLDVLGLVTFSPAVGLFWFAPFLLAGLVWLVPMVRAPSSRAQGIALVVALVLMLLFIAGFRGWRGGWSVGPRYISELIGVLAIPAALAFDRERTLLSRMGLGALVGITMLHSGIAGAFFPHLPDLFANPVHEMMLPLVALGLKPDWGVPALLVVLVLFAPIALQGRAAIAALVTITLVAMAAPLLHTTPRAKAALEARRMIDNWRPESDRFDLDDPRDLVAIGRTRTAMPLARARGCAGPLVVVPDEIALGLVHVVDEPMLMISVSDIPRTGVLPCTGDIAVLGDIPRALAKHTVARRDAKLTWLAR